jgi:DNA-binding XRE family transcriptional regulator
MRDMKVRGRTNSYKRRGERNGLAKLTELDVRTIKFWLSKGYTQQSIAQKFGVVSQNINNIAKGRSWAHV